MPLVVAIIRNTPGATAGSWEVRINNFGARNVDLTVYVRCRPHMMIYWLRYC